MKPSKFDSIFAEKRGRSEITPPLLSEHEPIQDKRPVGRPGGRGKSSNPDYTPVSIYLPRALYDEARIKLIREGNKEFSGLMEALLIQWLEPKQNH